MAFSLFGKSNVADLIIVNGHIYTQDPELPWVTGVACKDGKVLAVGSEEDMSQYQGKTTEVLDLTGHYMTPGLLDSYGTPVLDVFRQCCLFLDDSLSIADTLDQIASKLKADDGVDTFFAYGYASDLLKDLTAEEATSLLDKLEETRPILLLSQDGYGAWINTPALTMVQEAADEEALDILTLPFTFSVLNPFSYDAIQNSVVHQAWNYASKGITGIYNSGSPDVFDNIYQNVLVAMDQEGLLPQRHYGSLTIQTNINPEFVAHKLIQNRTKCIELDELINYNSLALFIQPKTLPLFSEEYLRAVFTAALERGFDIEIQGIGKEAVLTCYDALTNLKVPGGKKSNITFMHSEELRSDERNNASLSVDILEVEMSMDFTGSNADILEKSTLDAAEKLGLLDKLGTIEPGKYADFTIFESNPLEGNNFPSVSMTLIAGDVAYDKEEDHPDEWNRLVSLQNDEYED